MIRGYIREWLTLYDKKYSANEVEPMAGFLIDLSIVVSMTTLVLAIIIRLSIGPLGSDHWWFSIGSSIIVAPYLLRYKYHFRNISKYIGNLNEKTIKLKIHTALNSYRQTVRNMFIENNGPLGTWIILSIIIAGLTIIPLGEAPIWVWATAVIIESIIFPPYIVTYIVKWYRSSHRGSFRIWLFDEDLDKEPSEDSWLNCATPKITKKEKKKAGSNLYLVSLKNLLDTCGSLEDTSGKLWLFGSVLIFACIPYLVIASIFGDSLLLAVVLAIATPITFTYSPYILTVMLKFPKIIYAWLVAYAIVKSSELDEYVDDDKKSKEQDEPVTK